MPNTDDPPAESTENTDDEKTKHDQGQEKHTADTGAAPTAPPSPETTPAGPRPPPTGDHDGEPLASPCGKRDRDSKSNSPRGRSRTRHVTRRRRERRERSSRREKRARKEPSELKAELVEEGKPQHGGAKRRSTSDNTKDRKRSKHHASSNKRRSRSDSRSGRGHSLSPTPDYRLSRREQLEDLALAADERARRAEDKANTALQRTRELETSVGCLMRRMCMADARLSVLERNSLSSTVVVGGWDSQSNVHQRKEYILGWMKHMQLDLNSILSMSFKHRNGTLSPVAFIKFTGAAEMVAFSKSYRRFARDTGEHYMPGFKPECTIWCNEALSLTERTKNAGVFVFALCS